MNYIVNNDTSNNDATNINLINHIEVTHAFTRNVAVFWRLGLVFIYFRPAFSLSIISFSNRTLILPYFLCLCCGALSLPGVGVGPRGQMWSQLCCSEETMPCVLFLKNLILFQNKPF